MCKMKNVITMANQDASMKDCCYDHTRFGICACWSLEHTSTQTLNDVPTTSSTSANTVACVASWRVELGIVSPNRITSIFITPSYR
jgi:hypothetical protein